MAFLQEPRLKGLEIGSSEFFELQRQLISERPALKYCYDLWYKTLLDDPVIQGADLDAILVELGSGGSLLKSYDGRIITSDVSPDIAEKVIDARSLPFKDKSVTALFLTHVFHHIPDVRQFLLEAERVLVPSGVIAMIEVAATPFARFFFNKFHPEPFEPDRGWTFSQTHSMNDSNQALSWIVFERDRNEFEKSFPNLNLEEKFYLPWLPYLISGGVTRKNVVPNFLQQASIRIDRALPSLYPAFALHWYIKIRKRGSSI